MNADYCFRDSLSNTGLFDGHWASVPVWRFWVAGLKKQKRRSAEEKNTPHLRHWSHLSSSSFLLIKRLLSCLHSLFHLSSYLSSSLCLSLSLCAVLPLDFALGPHLVLSFRPSTGLLLCAQWFILHSSSSTLQHKASFSHTPSCLSSLTTSSLALPASLPRADWQFVFSPSTCPSGNLSVHSTTSFIIHLTIHHPRESISNVQLLQSSVQDPWWVLLHVTGRCRQPERIPWWIRCALPPGPCSSMRPPMSLVSLASLITVVNHIVVILQMPPIQVPTILDLHSKPNPSPPRPIEAPTRPPNWELNTPSGPDNEVARLLLRTDTGLPWDLPLLLPFPLLPCRADPRPLSPRAIVVRSVHGRRRVIVTWCHPLRVLADRGDAGCITSIMGVTRVGSPGREDTMPNPPIDGGTRPRVALEEETISTSTVHIHTPSLRKCLKKIRWIDCAAVEARSTQEGVHWAWPGQRISILTWHRRRNRGPEGPLHHKEDLTSLTAIHGCGARLMVLVRVTVSPHGHDGRQAIDHRYPRTTRIGMMAIILPSTKMLTTMTAIVNIVDDQGIITMTKSTAGREDTTALTMLTPFLNPWQGLEHHWVPRFWPVATKIPAMTCLPEAIGRLVQHPTHRTIADITVDREGHLDDDPGPTRKPTHQTRIFVITHANHLFVINTADQKLPTAVRSRRNI